MPSSGSASPGARTTRGDSSIASTTTSSAWRVSRSSRCRSPAGAIGTRRGGRDPGEVADSILRVGRAAAGPRTRLLLAVRLAALARDRASALAIAALVAEAVPDRAPEIARLHLDMGLADG
jgi:hypothetical protein